jgi:hypothetical protein
MRTSKLRQLGAPMPNDVLAYGTNRTIEGVTYTLERRLQSKGTILAKLGDSVKPETVIAEGKASAGFRVFRLGELLGLAPAKVQGTMHRTVGSRVYQGDVIAEAPKLLGLRRVQFLAPADGVIQDFNPETGRLTFQLAPATQRLPAGIAGTVSRIIPDEGVGVEAQVSMLFGSFATGRSREGAMRVIASPFEPISPSKITPNLRDHIVAGGSLVTKEIIQHCLMNGVKGIVSGGMAAHDLLEVSNTFNEQEDIGLTILITSGLGTMPMEEETYQFLEHYNEQQVFLIPKDKMLVAPTRPGMQAVTRDLADVPKGFLPLTVGSHVRLLGGERVGEGAVVEAILPLATTQESCYETVRCLLRLSNGDTIESPVTNVEVVARISHGSPNS